MRGCGVVIGGTLHLEMKGEFMIGAVDSEDAVDIRVAIHAIGRERGLGIALALENFLVHSAIARVAAAGAAGNVDDDLAGCLARIGIPMDRSLLELECSMNGVENVVQCELDLGLRGIEVQGHWARRR